MFKTLRYPGHLDYIRFLLDDLGLSSLDQLPPLDGTDVQESALDRLDFEALSAGVDAAAGEAEASAATTSAAGRASDDSSSATVAAPRRS